MLEKLPFLAALENILLKISLGVPGGCASFHNYPSLILEVRVVWWNLLIFVIVAPVWNVICWLLNDFAVQFWSISLSQDGAGSGHWDRVGGTSPLWKDVAVLLFPEFNTSFWLLYRIPAWFYLLQSHIECITYLLVQRLDVDVAALSTLGESRKSGVRW